ncbi:ERI1 exoribonuclease 3 [Acipenser ruthenus]|uniref:ERI1 exoribonuclease 3 n=1 Tax=Acipenser ruthenus TaxID=7906 RepID=A0A662YNM6_ACIRT|nr:ERI1 exoribonuclease 3 [Acipenser ruthenus]
MSYPPHFHYDKSNRKKVKVEISILNLDIRKTREAEEGETNERPGSALTGIIQSMVEGQPTLQQALQMVAEWMDKENLLNPDVSSVFVTCGDWDLKTMLPGQCQHLGLQAPDYFKQWINLKKAYSFAMGSWPKSGLPAMQEGLSLKQEGRLHSGIEV